MVKKGAKPPRISRSTVEPRSEMWKKASSPERGGVARGADRTFDSVGIAILCPRTDAGGEKFSAAPPRCQRASYGNRRSDRPGLGRGHPFRSGGENLDASTAAMLLGRVEPFKALDERARLTVVEHGTRRVVDKGQMVFWQDDPGEAMFVLLEGSVKLVVCSRDGELIELHRHDAPATFGELAILDGGLRSASAGAGDRAPRRGVPR